MDNKLAPSHGIVINNIKGSRNEKNASGANKAVTYKNLFWPSFNSTFTALAGFVKTLPTISVGLLPRSPHSHLVVKRSG